MTLSEWLSKQPRGAMTRLMRETGLAYSTLYYARDGGPKRLGLETAKKIVAATGGEVTLEELGEPEPPE